MQLVDRGSAEHAAKVSEIALVSYSTPLTRCSGAPVFRMLEKHRISTCISYVCIQG